jgi:xanthine dehydrogenase YagS FAD-binding subunit
MQPFDYIRAKSIDHAINEAKSSPSTFLAGGTELLNWMRIGIRTPKRVIDITGVSELSEIHRCGENGVRIGALVTLNQVAEAKEIVRDFPVLAQAVRKSASSQLRNMATIGGNPLQLPRCPYFRADSPVACNRRIAGSGCAALSGFNERHAIFGYDDFCVATHPSDPAVALAALDAVVVTASARGERQIRLEEFFKYSRSEPYSFSVLADDEIITSFELPMPAPNSAYLKVRERESYEYALVSSAVSLKIHGGVIEEARIALGSVSHKPWRLNATEALLRGLRCDSAGVSAAVDAGLQEAHALSSNAYKIVLARNATIRTIKLAAGTR